jgi:TonB family protein
VAWNARALALLLTLGMGAALWAPAPAQSAPSAEVWVTKPPIKVKRIRYTAPTYPPKALQHRLSGWVTIEFVINAKGEPTGLRVVDAQPAEIFDRAVLNAAKRWRYKPLVVDDEPAETPTRTVIRFETHG